MHMEQGFPSSLRTVRDNRNVRSISAKLNRSSESSPPPSLLQLTPLGLLLLLLLRSASISASLAAELIAWLFKLLTNDRRTAWCVCFCCCSWPGQKRRLMARFSFEKCSGAGQRQTDRLQSRTESKWKSLSCLSRGLRVKNVCAVGGVGTLWTLPQNGSRRKRSPSISFGSAWKRVKEEMRSSYKKYPGIWQLKILKFETNLKWF